jgi:hypothetical protein
MAGYSRTPLAKKLGIKTGFQVKLINAPEHYFSLFTDMPAGVTINEDSTVKKDFIHLFTKQLDEYTSLLPKLTKELKPAGMIWVSWPKRSSKVVTDVTEHLVRNFALQTGLVDIKVCAVDDVWSALKLVIPVKDRDFSV